MGLPHVTPDELAAYKAGQIDQRLDDHSERLNAINGSIATGAAALSDLATAVTEVKTTIKVTGGALAVLLPLVVAILLYFN